MGAPMKAMKTAKSMTKGAIADSLATSCELKKSVCAKMINSLAELAAAEVAKAGVFTLPGLCRLKTRTKPATKAGKREVFGKVVMEGEARAQDCEGLPGQSPQGQYLSRHGRSACLKPNLPSVGVL